MKTPPLAPGLSLRNAQWADVDSVAQLIYDVCEADGDTTVAVTPAELKSAWQRGSFNIETDAFVIVAPDGHVVGYVDFEDEQGHYDLHSDGYVHPQFKGKGIGTALLTRIEQRAREEMQKAEPDLRVFLRSTIDNRDIPSNELHKMLGYFPKRYHWRMEITLESAPPVPVLPAGLEFRPFIKGEQDIAVWQAQNEAFRDHWGSHDSTFEDFTHDRFNYPNFDPTLWQIIWDGNEIAAFSLNRIRMGIGWVGTLGVRRPWRKKGLGLALLHASFGEFYKRGHKTIGLGVDASNPTGATRLYQRAGMHVASEFLTYEKELRPGRSLEE